MFKNLRALLFCSLFSAGLMAEEAADADRTMAISVSPLSLLFGANALFQYNVANFLTLTLPATFSYSWEIPLVLKWLSSKGTTLETSKAPISVSGGLGARFYPTAKGMTDGFYLEPRLVVRYSQFGAQAGSLGKVEWSQTSLVPRLHLGWDWFWDSGFYMNFGGGVGWAFDIKPELNVSPGLKDAVKHVSRFLPILPNPESKNRPDLDLEFKLGYAW